MKPLSPRENTILASFVLIAALMGLDHFVVTPLSHKWDGLDRDIASYQAELKQDLQLLANQKAIHEEFSSYKGVKSIIYNVDPDDMAGLLRAIQTIAVQSGMKISDLKPESTENQNKSEKSVDLSAHASWETVMRFMYDIERSPNLLKLTHVSLHREGDSHILSAQFVINKSSLNK